MPPARFSPYHSEDSLVKRLLGMPNEKPISLADALASGDLEAFIQQEEAEGRHVDRAEFERRLGGLIKAPAPERRTSRSPSRGGSRGR
jgi:hypothetical protein